MKRLATLFFTIGLILLTLPAFSWDSVGHRLVAYIAYQHLKPNVKRQVNRLTKMMFHSRWGDSRFMRAATWPDSLRYDDVDAFNQWHFIDYPYSTDGTKGARINPENVAWAVGQSIQVLKSTKSNRYQRAVFLSFLIHFVGDAHQPMHCIDRYSRAFPNGDKGGNLYPIRSRYANNLHSLWDQGVNLFHVRSKKYPLRYFALRKLAKTIAKRYPESSLQHQVGQLNSYEWTQKSFAIAKEFAYQIKPNARPSRNYLEQGQAIVQKRIALAAYRLARILNQKFG